MAPGELGRGGGVRAQPPAGNRPRSAAHGGRGGKLKAKISQPDFFASRDLAYKALAALETAADQLRSQAEYLGADIDVEEVAMELASALGDDAGDDGDLRRVLDEAFHWLSKAEETGGELEKYVELHRDRLNEIAAGMIKFADAVLQIRLPFELKQDPESD